MPFSNKTALITGAAGGIGAATARLLRAQGIGALILLDVNTDALQPLADELAQGDRPPAVHCCVADIAERAQLQAALRPALQALQKVDILAHCAGISGENLPDDIDTWHRIINVNLHGAYHATLEALEVMPDGGRIIHVASVMGRIGRIRNTAYCTSKHALLGFTKSLALDLATRKITVNAVLPGAVDTPMYQREIAQEAEKAGLPPEQLLRSARKQIPMRRLVDPSEVAALIAFLASPEAAAITAQSYVIDGGALLGC